jgi:hypothetical protein
LASGFGAGHDRLRSEDTLLLSAESRLDVRREFADPDNFDYRLQPTSRFRGTGPEGADPGAFPYRSDVFYVSPDGNDDDDGLAVASAWRTLAHAARQLRPGSTLYLLEGTYPDALSIAARSGDSHEPFGCAAGGLGRS